MRKNYVKYKQKNKQTNFYNFWRLILKPLYLIPLISILCATSSFGDTIKKPTTAPKPQATKQVDSANVTISTDRMREIKNKDGKIIKMEWWRELTYCGGKIYGLGELTSEDPEKAKILKNNGTLVANFGVQRLMVDRKIDLKTAQPFASESFTSGVNSFKSAYWTYRALGTHQNYIDTTMKECQTTLTEYSQKFPELFKGKN